MTTGGLVSFGDSQLSFLDSPLPNCFPATKTSIAYAVAASSAFPPAFPPLRLRKEFGSEGHPLKHDHFLADGGVFDNLGIRRLLLLDCASKPGFDAVIVSDAQVECRGQYGNLYRFIWSRAVRATDLLMNRISWCEGSFINRSCRDNESALVICSLKANVSKDSWLSPIAQEQVKRIRTDLNAFSDDEIDALICHGQATAKAALMCCESLKTNDEWTENTSSIPWRPFLSSRGSLLQLSDSHRFRFGLFNAADPASWVLWGLIVMWILIPTGLFVQSRRSAIKEKNRADKAELQLNRLRAAETAHVESKVAIVEALSNVTMAESPQEYELAVDRWKAIKEQLARQSWFGELFDTNEQIKRIERHMAQGVLKPGTFSGVPEEMRNDLHLLTRYLRMVIERAGGNYVTTLYSKRSKWFADVREAASQISRWASSRRTPKGLAVSHRNFWRLYYGEMALVENDRVFDAMVQFGDVYRKWEQSGVAADQKVIRELQVAEHLLRDAIDGEMSAITAGP